jgi:hypothetical protein
MCDRFIIINQNGHVLGTASWVGGFRPLCQSRSCQEARLPTPRRRADEVLQDAIALADMGFVQEADELVGRYVEHFGK